MVSTTSGLTQFNLDVDDIIERALAPVGGDYTNARDQEAARVNLNLLLIELQNKNIPLNKVGTETISLLDSTATYILSANVSDVLEANLKEVSSGTSTSLNRYGRKEYHDIPNKDKEDRPTLFMTDRGANTVSVTVWPVPKADGLYTVEALVAKRIEDINASFQKIDLPYRYFPLIVSWLSYKLSLEKQGVGEEIKNRLKMEYQSIMMDTFDEDRERVDFIVTPGGISGI